MRRTAVLIICLCENYVRREIWNSDIAINMVKCKGLWADNALYRGGIDLPLGDDTGKSYTLTTYAMSYGVKSSKAVYYIDQINNRFKLTVNDLTDKKDYFYKAEDKVSISAQYGQSADVYFMKWTASLYDADGNKVAEDITDKLLAKNAATADFVMPKLSDKYDDTNNYPENYSLEFNAVYGDRINHVVAGAFNSLLEPTAGQPLSTSTNVSFISGERRWGSEDGQGGYYS